MEASVARARSWAEREGGTILEPRFEPRSFG
jgi:hypothetical protein